MSNDVHEHPLQQPSAADQAQLQPQAFYRPKPDGATDPAGEAGWYLERERERRGLSLQTVSRAIGVHPQHVRAIELGMLENLPERDQALKMIGAYARFLGFDPQPLVEHFANCLPKPEARQSRHDNTAARVIAFPLVERLREMSRTPAGMGASALAVVLLVGGLAWGFWPANDATAPPHEMLAKTEAGDQPTRQTRATQPAPAASPQEIRLAAQRPDATPVAETSPTGAKGADPIAALITRTIGNLDEQPAPARETASTAPEQSGQQHGGQQIRPVKKARALPLPPPPMPTERPASAGESTPAAPAAANAASTADAPLSPAAMRPLSQVPGQGIALRAAEQIWLRLEDDRGTPWYVGFLKAGQVLALPSDKALRLSASDVHRLEWYVNGQRMGRLGKRGADFLSEPLSGLYKQSGLKAPGAKPAAG